MLVTSGEIERVYADACRALTEESATNCERGTAEKLQEHCNIGNYIEYLTK